jgi:hypothetical protein
MITKIEKEDDKMKFWNCFNPGVGSSCYGHMSSSHFHYFSMQQQTNSEQSFSWAFVANAKNSSFMNIIWNS